MNLNFLVAFLEDWCFNKHNNNLDLHSHLSQNGVHLYIEKTSLKGEYSYRSKKTEFELFFEDINFGKKLYSVVFFSRLHPRKDRQKIIHLKRTYISDGAIDLFDSYFLSEQNGKIFNELKNEYDTDIEFFLIQLNKIINDG